MTQVLWLLVFFAMVWLSGLMAGMVIMLRMTTKHLKEQNDLLEKQSKIIADYKQQEDSANWWKPKDWKADWEEGDA